MSDLAGYFERVRERTIRVARCIPREQIEWTCKAGKFTFGDILRHLAGVERWMFAENAQQRPSRYPGHGRELADGYDAVFDYLRRLHEESMAIFRSLTDADLEKNTLTPGGAELRIGKWLRLMAEHEIHHRGAIYVYLGILGVEAPPLYGLTEEQVHERSRILC